jgi:hypothetical protein
MDNANKPKIEAAREAELADREARLAALRAVRAEINAGKLFGRPA